VKVVLDTNVLLSGLMFPEGTPGRIIAAWGEARSEVIELGPISIEVPRDPDDVPILATLVTAKADVLVTGDGDPLALRDRYPIETPAEFVRRL